MLRHLAIYSSPRSGGFSSAAHDLLIRAKAREDINTEIIRVYDLRINPCTACGSCAVSRGCAISDDMERIYRLIAESDFITISSPLYFSSIPGQLKNLIDRCQTLWEDKRRGITIPPKKGALIIAAGSELKGVPVHASAVIKHFLNTINCSLAEGDIYTLDRTDGYSGIPSDLTGGMVPSWNNFWTA